MSILEATDAVNVRQRGVMLEKIIAHFGGSLAGKVVAVWGIAFKPRTDDIREAPAIPLIEGLLAQGASVKAWDRAAVKNAKARFGDKVSFGEDEYAVCDGADALVVMTEWPEFRMPDWADVERRLKAKVVFDGRNIYDGAMLRSRGFRYHGIGRV
jgi:UDPglucose 6-dehydrogenase